MCKPKDVFKSAPFNLPILEDDYPLFAHLLVNSLQSLDEAPDFSQDESVAVFSDFGGEHKGADFLTYSFLFVALDKIMVFENEISILRQKYEILEPYSEFSFKDLKFGKRSRALTEFLYLADKLIHGALITIAVDKQIDTLFGKSKLDLPMIEDQLFNARLGRWSGKTAEKVLRICHAISIFSSLLTSNNHKLFWYCDNDSINENANLRNFTDTQKLLNHILPLYIHHEIMVIGFAKSFQRKSYLDDLLSITDLASGIVQDLLKAHKTGKDIESGGLEKIELINWLARKSQFLSKITIQINPISKDEFSCDILKITPVLN